MADPRFAHLRDEREIQQGELWLTKSTPTFPSTPPARAPSQPRVVVILSPNDVNKALDSFDIRVAPLAEQVEQASELDLKLDLSQDAAFDSPAHRDWLAQSQIIELWNDQNMLKVNLDRRLGHCTASIQDRIKQVLRWSYGVEPCPAVPSWVGTPITEPEDARLRFQDQEREATRFLRDPVEQLYRLVAADESEETEAEFALDEREEAEYIAAFAAWQEEIRRENQARDERLNRFLRESLRPDELAALKGSCPDTQTLVAYQEGTLPIAQADELQRHVVFCRSCLEEVVALGRAAEIDYDPERDYDPVALSQQLRQKLFGHPGLKDRIADQIAHAVREIIEVVRQISAPWFLPLAGVPVGAADIPPQEHVFQLGEGFIQVTCRWWAAAQGQPATVWLEWKTDTMLPGDLWVRFTQRDNTSVILAERPLGHAFRGECSWVASELGFDPLNVPWALILLVKAAQV
jgi:hypothetical protein